MRYFVNKLYVLVIGIIYKMDSFIKRTHFNPLVKWKWNWKTPCNNIEMDSFKLLEMEMEIKYIGTVIQKYQT